LPTDWQPDEITILTARNVGLSPEATMATLDKFRDHHQTKGTLNADWQAAARMWLKDQPRFQQPAMVGNGPPIPIRDNIIRHGDPPDENPF